MSSPSAYHLEQAMSCLQSVASRMMADDPGIEHDAAGFYAALTANEPDAMHVLHRLIRAADEAGIMADANKERLADLKARADRFKAREKEMRGAIMAALDALGMKRLDHAEFTVSVRDGGQSPIVTSDAELPEEYWRVTREHNLAKIRDDVKQGIVIPGVVMSNGLPSLQIRTK